MVATPDYFFIDRSGETKREPQINAFAIGSRLTLPHNLMASRETHWLDSLDAVIISH